MSDPSDSSSQRVHPFDALATIGCIYLALITFGFAAFRYLAVLPSGAKRNQDVTFFSSANVVSLTGFEHVNAAVANYPTLGLIVVSLLALTSALTALIGGGYLLARAVRWRVPLHTIAIGSAIILAIPLASGPVVGGFNAISASTGLGLWTRPMPTGIGEAVAIGLTILGALGVLPILEFASEFKKDRQEPADDSGAIAATLVATALLVIVGMMLLWFCGDRWTDIGQHSIALRAFGGAGGPPVGASTAMPWAAMFLSLIGAAPASTAGGLSVLPIVIAARGASDLLQGRPAHPLLGISLVWIATFTLALAFFTIVTAALAAALPGERVLMLVCSALGNVGISYEPVGVTGSSLFLLSAAMLIGRMLPFVMLAWMACVAERPTPSLRSP